MATLPNPLPKLAADPAGRSLGLDLPAGRLIDTTDEGSWHEPLLWCADEEPAAGTWSALHSAGRTVGLLPLLVDVGGSQGGPPDWELMPEEMSYPGDHDAEEVLSAFWDQYAKDGAATGPAGAEWPGLAPAGVLDADPDARAAEVAEGLLADGTSFKAPRCALVPARRSADIPAAIGWSGPLNHETDVARLCSVLRSWEDRFGIRVVALTFDRLTVSVAAPPATEAEAEALAAEHFAFCPDTTGQGDDTTLRAYAGRQLLNRPLWHFWWD
ncbi:DUF4253 domain-containing protein [Streptomyces sp. ALI-76-A]|jgi:hypothetical protein|uniref:DUF4253 domain-containing protein n=1 Tax=Streptomyces sp. ALI-76-A TaxID=3025736 RepID=UPI00256EE8BA|nr:DUF4253 domain-containing protein [Streptomyces sp. ALI-76-A]MDL5203055.1 DUF4253 domain-containing protein [Streptomyces sp. ALI-76-A]